MILAMMLATALQGGAVAAAPPEPHCGLPKGRAWISANDYPPGALHDRVEGDVSIAVDVAPTGCPSACRVTTSSGDARLDDTTCRIVLERGRYAPPRDPAGQPTTATKTLTMRWRLP